MEYSITQLCIIKWYCPHYAKSIIYKIKYAIKNKSIIMWNGACCMQKFT